MEAIQTWLDISIKDLEASKLLYNNGLYSNSYFLFQQSVEKANKAFGLFTGKITEKELEDFKHDQFKIYRKLFVQQRDKAQEFINVLDQNPQLSSIGLINEIDFKSHHHSLDKGVRFIDSLRNLNLVDIPAKDLNFLLRELKKIEKQKIKLPKHAKQIVFQKLADFIGAIPTPEAQVAKDAFEKFNEDKVQSNQYWNVIVDWLPKMMDILFVYFTFYFCALVTIQHSSITRYPDQGDSSLSLYTADLPVVKKQLQFMMYLEKALLKFQKLAEN